MNFNEKKVYIVVLNYNNWTDTIACAKSILFSDYQNFQLIIVDNASTDNSVRHIKKWLDGDIEPWSPKSDLLRYLFIPPLKKRIDYDYYESIDFSDRSSLSSKRVILIRSDKNNGYGDGNNLGIRFAVEKEDYEYIWILNNDTLVKKETLKNLISCAQTKKENAGLFGTTLLFYDAPEKIQAFGGSFNYFLAVQKHNLSYQDFSPKKIENFDKKKLDYIIGASMLMTKKYIQKAGLMPKEYFIYFEEIDIATRCKRNALELHICPEAIVYHKESASIDKEDQKLSSFSDFYALRNRLVFTKKYFPYFLPSVYLGLLFSLMLRFKRGDKKGIKNILRILKTPLSKMTELNY